MNKFFTILAIGFISLSLSTVAYSQRKLEDLDKALFLLGELGTSDRFVATRHNMTIYNKSVRVPSSPPNSLRQEPLNRPLRCSDDTINLRARFKYADEQGEVEPNIVEMVLESNRAFGSYFKKEKTRHLRIIADKKEYDFGIMTRIKRRVRNKGVTGRCPIHTEKLIGKIPAETFLKIVASKKVKLKFGKFRIRIDNEREYSGLEKLAIELQK